MKTIKPRPIQTYLRLPPDLHAWVSKEGDKQFRSTNEQIIYIINEAKNEC